MCLLKNTEYFSEYNQMILLNIQKNLNLSHSDLNKENNRFIKKINKIAQNIRIVVSQKSLHPSKI